MEKKERCRESLDEQLFDKASILARVIIVAGGGTGVVRHRPEKKRRG